MLRREAAWCEWESSEESTMPYNCIYCTVIVESAVALAVYLLRLPSDVSKQNKEMTYALHAVKCRKNETERIISLMERTVNEQ